MKSHHPCLQRVAVLILVVFTLNAVTSAQTPAAAEQQPTTVADWTDMLATNYEAQSNITYRRANNTDLKLDLYLPRDRSKPLPVVMSIHGGGWVAGTKEGSVLSLMPYLQMGFAVVNVEYRLAANSLAPAAVGDCRCALHWVTNNAKRFNFDLERVVVTGGSAGGHLALTTGLLTPDAGFDRGCTPPQDLRWEKADMTVPKVAAIEWFGSLSDRDQLARRVTPVHGAEVFAAGSDHPWR